MELRTFAPTLTQLRMLDAPPGGGNLCAVFRLQGRLDEKRLARAIAETIRAAVPFSHRFLRINDSHQIVASPEPGEGLSVIDVRQADEAHVYEIIKSMAGRGFRLDGGAPYLFCLLQGRKDHHLVFACHPALIDRFSLKPLFAAISRAYRGEALGNALGLPQEELLDAERRLLASPRRAESLRFWLHLGRETSFEWRPARLEGDLGATYFQVRLSKQRSAALVRLARELAIAPGQLLLFSFHLLLSRLTRSDTVMTSYCHRIRGDAPEGIGFSENKPAFKSVIEPGASVRRYFQQAAKLHARTRYYSDLPAREAAQELQRIDPGFQRMTNVLFNRDALPYRELTLAGVEATLLPSFSHRFDNEDVAVFFDLEEETIIFDVMTRFPQQSSSLKTAFAHYQVLLGALERELDRPAGAVELFSRPLRARAVALADGGPLRTRPRDFIACLVQAARKQPQAPAVRYGERVVSYEELLRSARRVASGLAPHCRGSAEPIVGLCLERSSPMVEAIVGALWGAAAYLPLDPKTPAERLALIAADAKCAAVITDESTRALISALVKCPVLGIEALLAESGEGGRPPAAAPAGRAAYVIYTSGTTGKPKGVVIERGMLAHFIASLEGACERGPGSRWLQFASINFDASVLEIFNPLSRGGELVVAPEAARTDPEALFTLLLERRVTHAWLPPALLPLLPRRALPELKSLFCGGEAIDEEAARFWSKFVKLDNCYGPTEATVMATLGELGGYKAATHLGRPLPGCQTYLLDEGAGLAPLGGVGEICIGGPAVARGYLRRPELTAQKFIPNPFGPGRLYRSGDLARFLPNGELEFLGRSDFQVKIRGFRVELGDIEAAISEQPEVKGAHVAAVDRAGGKALAAWYVAEKLPPEALRRRLRKRLPNYMVPAFLVRVDAFALNVNGKIDRARLPDPTAHQGGAEDAALDELEGRIRGLWAEGLKTPAAGIGLASHFFHLGGHSLSAALVCSRLGAWLGAAVRPKLLFEHPVLADFCERVRALPKEAPLLPPIPATAKLAAPVADRLIELMLARATLNPSDNTYNIVTRVAFSRATEPRRLRDALQGLVEGNPIFRAAFAERGGRLWVEAGAKPPPAIRLRKVSAAELEARAESLRRLALDLRRPPLWRAEILVADGAAVLLFCIHHSLFDGWSFNLLLAELGERYAALAQGRAVAPRPLTWFDYCAWGSGLGRTRPYLDALAYWRGKLAGAVARVELPVQFHQKRPDSNRCAAVRIDPETARALQHLADAKEITLAPLLFAIYLVWLWRLSDQEEIVCGYPNAGRDAPGSEGIYGMMVAMGFLRQKVRADQDFGELAAAVHRQMLDDKENLVATPYDAKIAGMDSINAIFSLQSGIGLSGDFGGAGFQAEELPSLTSKADLTGTLYQSADGGIAGRIEYDASLFEPAVMERLAGQFSRLVASVAGRPQAKVSELAYRSDAEAAQFLKLSQGAPFDPPERSIAARFAEMARAHAGRVAVECEGRQLTYRELDAWSDRAAAALPRELAPGSLVGLSLGKNEALIAAVLAILKRGCAYVPLDPRYPPERLRYFAKDCGLRFVLADDASRAALQGAGLTGLEFCALPSRHGLAARARRAPPAAADGLAYVIHTSGSTGTPKGVMVENRYVVRMILAAAWELGFWAESSLSLVASMNFDASVLEIFIPLLNGGRLHVVPEGARQDPARLHADLRAARLSHVILAPAMLRGLPRKPWPGLQVLAFGGDTLDEASAAWWSARTKLVSLYGPTECTVMASLGRIAPGTSYRSIGRPLPGYRIYLLNREKQPVPIGAVGEICIAGEGLARGYLGRDEQTMERFVVDPFGSSPYATMYLSGDLGRFLPDGAIEFVGRNDAQIKLRGFRVELGEIESRLASFPGIAQAVCAVKGQGENRCIVAYYLAPEAADAEALRGHLAAFLPDYMVPAFFVRLPSFPLSPSGKIDRAALPMVSAKACADPPKPGRERAIADVWEEVLCLKGVSRDESFFHLGGNSLLVVRMQAELRQRLGLEFALCDFYGAPTVAALARGGTAGHIAGDVADAIADARAELAVTRPAPSASLTRPPRRFLLTGAGGFLGIHLLSELCRQAESVHCLLRCADERAGGQALRRQAHAARLDIAWERVRILPGDLAAPGLGLSGSARAGLAAEIDAIAHCGAFVHHLHGYQALRAANVGGTKALLELAAPGKLKSFCFISTLTAGALATGASAVREEVRPEPPAVDNGYLLSKWAAEQLAAAAGARYGLPVLIARPGNITGASATGFSNFANNHFWLFIKGCLQLGAYPDTTARVEMTPVDELARAMTALALSPRPGVSVANLDNPESLSQREFFTKLAACGCPARPLAPRDWQRLLPGIGEDNALWTIREFYASGEIPGAGLPVEHARTRARLAAAGLGRAVDYDKLIPLYVDSLRQAGFL